jgi:chromosome segregation ATPase
MDRMLQSFHETVVAHDKSQQARFQQLQMENEKLRKANQEVEIENLKYFKEVQDCEEQIDEMDAQRKVLAEMVSSLREDKLSLSSDVAFWKAEVEKEKSLSASTIDSLQKENDALKAENEALRNDLNEYTDWFSQKDRRVQELESDMNRLKNELENKENIIFSSLKSLQQR